ncbi:hypothetical protein [Turicibacter sanguinis]|uniref:hypothetical protein n=1 Tax=Turicibacter sanguinis TaxID=154288 RepID=UPI0018A0A6BC|nr:hypothetical protein [Turicibacter sanguinis]
MKSNQTQKKIEIEKRRESLIDFYFHHLNKKQHVTKEMIKEFYKTISDKQSRTMSSDLNAIGLKPYGGGDSNKRYYKLDIVEELREIMMELNKLLKKVEIYKPIVTTTTLEVQPKLNHVPEITFFKIILQYSNSTPEQMNHLIMMNSLLERYLILTKNSYFTIFYKTEYTTNGIEYTLTNKRNTILIFKFLYDCKCEISGKNKQDITIYFYKQLYNQETISNTEE